MRLYLQILVLTTLLYSCRGGMSNRDSDFNIDLTGDNTPCSEQTSPSPQCPQTEEKEDKNEELDTPAGSGAHNSVSGPTQLTTYKDGKYGKITLNPATMKKNTEAELEMTFTFTAPEAINRTKVPITLTVDFPPPATGFELKDNIEVSPATAQKFFKRDPSGFTSDVTNMATAELMTMGAGEKFTLTFTITPQQNFDFKAYTSFTTGKFKNSRGEMPEIIVYEGVTPPVITHDLSPVYTSGKLEMRVKPWPHRIKKDTDSELTLTFTALTDLKKKVLSQNHGQLTHNVAIGITPSSAVADRRNYMVTSVSSQKYFKNGKKPLCSIPRNCKLKIVEMEKGESFELKLKVNASENFSIGWASGTFIQLKKKPDRINPELDNKPPQIKVH